MPSANEGIRNAEIGRQVDLARYSNGVVRRIIALLNRVDADLMAQLAIAVDAMEGESFSIDRLDSLLASVRDLNARAYQQVGETLATELRGLTDAEAAFQLRLFASQMPELVSIASVNAEQVYAAAMARPFQGRVLREWASAIEQDRLIRIRDAIRMGVVENQATPEIVRRIRGTRAGGYADGLLEIDRRSAEAVTRTAVSYIAGFVRSAFYVANAEVVKAIVWTATLDSRTTLICQLRDGCQYTVDTHRPIGHAYPWLGGPGAAHWNCRSSSVALTKSYRELGLPIDELTPTERASMDGAVPAETTYAEWLKAQSAARQDEILGPTRGRMMREGGYTLDRFANDKGRWLTLDELKAR